MAEYIIKQMQTDCEISGKAYVHCKSWHETYTGLIDTEYLKKHTLEKCEKIAHQWTDNIIVAKDGDKISQQIINVKIKAFYDIFGDKQFYNTLTLFRCLCNQL